MTKRKILIIVLVGFLAVSIPTAMIAGTIAFYRHIADRSEQKPKVVTHNQQQPKSKPQISTEALDYFYAIALGSEFEQASTAVRKWNRPEVTVEMRGKVTAQDTTCLNKVVETFNELSTETDLTVVSSGADIVTYYASEADFPSILPEYTPGNSGYFYMNMDFKKRLTGGTILISSDRPGETQLGITEAERCHLLREELTQSMGLMKDSSQYPDSTFYTEWTDTQDYSALDRELIRILYGGNGIEAGFQQDDVEKLFTRTQ